MACGLPSCGTWAPQLQRVDPGNPRPHTLQHGGSQFPDQGLLDFQPLDHQGIPGTVLFKGASKEQVPNTKLEEKQCFSVGLGLSFQDGWGGICGVSYPTSIPHSWLTAHLFPLGRFPPPPAPAVASLLLFSRRVVSDSLQPHGLQPARLLSPWDFPGQGSWSRLPFSSPGNLPYPGIKPASPASAGGFFTTEPPGKPMGPLKTQGTRHSGKSIPSLESG